MFEHDLVRKPVSTFRDHARLFPKLAQDRADDVGVVIGPDPLLGVGLLQLPGLRLGDRAEVLVLGRCRDDGAEEQVPLETVIVGNRLRVKLR